MHSEPKYMSDETQIGRGMRPLAQHGTLLVVDDQIVLQGTKGDTIARAPVTEARVRVPWYAFGKNVHITMHGTRYVVAPQWGHFVGKKVLPGQTRIVNEEVKRFLATVQAHQDAPPTTP